MSLTTFVSDYKQKIINLCVQPDELEDVVQQAVAGGARASSSSVTTEEPKAHAPFEFSLDGY
jgi:hypothetical protein